MPDSAAPKFSCDACKRTYVWKEALAGKQVKCKCGQTFTAPASTPAPPAEPDDLYDLAEDPAPTVKHRAPPMATAVNSPTQTAGRAVSKSSAVPLAYQRGPTARERSAADSLIDITRDVHVPVALLICGFLLYVGFYALHYRLGPTGIIVTSLGLGILTAFKAAMLVGFALFVAGPLGVSFGGIWTAVLKLAAIAVFCDGLCTWIDAGVGKFSGGLGSGGLTGFGVISFPIALGIYWALLIYLFSMDPGDSWLVVIILSIFDRIVRTVLVVLLLNLILGWGGVPSAMTTAATGSPPSGTSSSASAFTTRIDEERDTGALQEAKEYIGKGHQIGLLKYANDWYAAGCKNVWFQMSNADINGRRDAEGLVLELPTDKSARAKCYEILKGYYQDVKIEFDPSEHTDDGEPYLEVEMRNRRRCLRYPEDPDS